MIRDRAGGRPRAFDHVQAIHLGRGPVASHPALRGELLMVAKVSRAAREEVGVQRNDHVGAIEVILRLDDFAEREPGPLANVVTPGRFVHVPARLGSAGGAPDLSRERGSAR